jgi:hypothetical protein
MRFEGGVDMRAHALGQAQHDERWLPVRLSEIDAAGGAWADGRVEIRCQGRKLPYSIFDKNPQVDQGAIVENKRLGAVLAFIHAAQQERDRVRLASKKLTLREKARIRLAARQAHPLSNRTLLLGQEADIST